jgi:UDP-N-acetylmuramoyl-L-alanyl-D-glutamate--2,6-diaminopimelate ligase
MQLPKLLSALSVPLPSDLPDAVVTAVTEDSRRVVPGVLFVARSGATTDGARFLSDAAARGAVAAVVSARVAGLALPQIEVADPASAVSVLANALAGNPSHALPVLGVTGTNGKTTTAYLLRHLLAHTGKRCGLIGTVETDDGATVVESTMTTPTATDLAELLARQKSNGCAAVAMEVSSQGLHQGRVAGVRFAGAGFTNLTGDHLDYHKSMEAYADAKALLFASLPSSAVAVVNGEHEWTPRMVRDCKARVVRFAFGREAEYRAESIEVTASGTVFTLRHGAVSKRLRMSLIGRHNIENALTAIGLAVECLGLTLDHIESALATAGGAPGRLQAVRLSDSQPFAVLVDYAHTDDALQNVLTALRPLTRGKLRVVFGCGGDRDPTKRPRMARVAERLADALYITSDNPRTEDPDKILREVAAGLSSPPAKPTHIEVDRRTSIQTAIRHAGGGDVVLIAGKGHENYQIVGTQKHHFDDVEEARRTLAEPR